MLWSWLDAGSYSWPSAHGSLTCSRGWNISSFQCVKSSQMVCTFRWQSGVCVFTVKAYFYNWGRGISQAPCSNPTDRNKSMLEEFNSINTMTRFNTCFYKRINMKCPAVDMNIPYSNDTCVVSPHIWRHLTMQKVWSSRGRACYSSRGWKDTIGWQERPGNWARV